MCFLFNGVSCSRRCHHEDELDRPTFLSMTTEFSLSRFHQVSSELAEEESPKLSTFLSMFNEITNLFRIV